MNLIGSFLLAELIIYSPFTFLLITCHHKPTSHFATLKFVLTSSHVRKRHIFYSTIVHLTKCPEQVRRQEEVETLVRCQLCWLIRSVVHIRNALNHLIWPIRISEQLVNYSNHLSRIILTFLPSTANPYQSLLTELPLGNTSYKFYDISKLEPIKFGKFSSSFLINNL